MTTKPTIANARRSPGAGEQHRQQSGLAPMTEFGTATSDTFPFSEMPQNDPPPPELTLPSTDDQPAYSRRPNGQLAGDFEHSAQTPLRPATCVGCWCAKRRERRAAGHRITRCKMQRVCRGSRRAIRAFCLSCVCGQRHEVELCPATRCPLFGYRFGMRPATAQAAGKTVTAKGGDPA